MNNILKLGFSLLSIILIVYGFLGLLHVEVWIRNRGWIELSLSESIFFLIFGFLLIAYIKTSKKDRV